MLKIVKTRFGYVRGIAAADPRIVSFKGIPFAAPPVGERRWCAPEPCEKWDGVKACLEFAPIAMQSIPGLDQENIYTKEWNVDPEIPMSEDCLYLNIWTPACGEDEKLPVYVWFHGGAFQWGNCAEMEFDGERIARRGIIVVTVSYRLNAFGFLSLPGVSSNLGILDQQFAIRWVYENIGAFGGNARNITIGGQSAGGGSVVAQLKNPENKKYVKRAVIESGIFSEDQKRLFSMTEDDSVKQGKEFLKFLGVSSIDEAKALSAEFIRDKNDEFGKLWGIVNEEKKILDIPLFLGWTDHEFLMDTPDGEINAVEVGTRRLCDRRSEEHCQSPNYVYEFCPEIPGEDRPGAFHSSDLWFFFETLAKCWRPFTGAHYDLAKEMCDALCNFIKDGDPKWKPYTKENQQVKVFGGEEARDFGFIYELQRVDFTEEGLHFVPRIAYGMDSPRQYMECIYKDGMKNRPVIFWIHGGAWDDEYVNVSSYRPESAFAELAKKGYFIACVEYRLFRHAELPACIEDCKKAIGYLKEHAEELSIDAKNLVLWGESAGAHIACMLASDHIGKGTVCFACPSDLLAQISFMGELGFVKNALPKKTLSKEETAQRLKEMSPITYADKKNLPPFLLFHGEEDEVVDKKESIAYCRKLQEAGNQAELILIPEQGHGIVKGEQYYHKIESFFEKCCGR